jgi:hypothetical protein
MLSLRESKSKTLAIAKFAKDTLTSNIRAKMEY